MSKTASAVVTFTVLGDGVGMGGVPYLTAVTPANNNAAPPGSAVLAAGNNTILIPNSANGLPYTVNGVFVVPPSTSTNAKTLKGVTGDTGVPLAPASFAYIPLLSTQASFVLNSAGTEEVALLWA